MFASDTDWDTDNTQDVLHDNLFGKMFLDVKKMNNRLKRKNETLVLSKPSMKRKKEKLERISGVSLIDKKGIISEIEKNEDEKDKKKKEEKKITETNTKIVDKSDALSDSGKKKNDSANKKRKKKKRKMEALEVMPVDGNRESKGTNESENAHNNSEIAKNAKDNEQNILPSDIMKDKSSKKKKTKKEKSNVDIQRNKEELRSTLSVEKVDSKRKTFESTVIENTAIDSTNNKMNDISTFHDSNHIPKKKYSKFQEKLSRQLEGGQFRWINEKLYTSNSNDAFSMFATHPKLFQVYHKGFVSQVQHWPENPVDVVINYVQARDPSLVVADFGCGDAKLSQNVPNKVHSFDLVAVNEKVTSCDMRNVPLSNGSVDVTIFCLSLMGTNLSDFLLEARRVLKVG